MKVLQLYHFGVSRNATDDRKSQKDDEATQSDRSSPTPEDDISSCSLFTEYDGNEGLAWKADFDLGPLRGNTKKQKSWKLLLQRRKKNSAMTQDEMEDILLQTGHQWELQQVPLPVISVYDIDSSSSEGDENLEFDDRSLLLKKMTSRSFSVPSKITTGNHDEEEATALLARPEGMTPSLFQRYTGYDVDSVLGPAEDEENIVSFQQCILKPLDMATEADGLWEDIVLAPQHLPRPSKPVPKDASKNSKRSADRRSRSSGGSLLRFAVNCELSTIYEGTDEDHDDYSSDEDSSNGTDSFDVAHVCSFESNTREGRQLLFI